MKILKRLLRFRESNLLLVVLICFTILAFTKPVFISMPNLLSMLNYISENAIIVGAVTIILISGCIDLSVGSILGFCGILNGVLIMNYHFPVPVAIILTILVAAAAGLINGYIISYIGINSLIVTLCTLFIFLSLKFIINNASHVSHLPDSFRIIAKYKILGIPSMAVLAIVSFLIFEILLRKNAYFRYNYFIGNSEYAAKLAGIKLKRVKMFNYMFSAVMAGIAGIFSSARFGTAYTSAGTDTHFILIAAIIIGGASLKGGKGSVVGSIIGIFFLALIYDAIVLFDLNLFLNDVALGAVIILSMCMEVFLEKRRKLQVGG